MLQRAHRHDVGEIGELVDLDEFGDQLLTVELVDLGDDGDQRHLPGEAPVVPAWWRTRRATGSGCACRPGRSPGRPAAGTRWRPRPPTIRPPHRSTAGRAACEGDGCPGCPPARSAHGRWSGCRGWPLRVVSGREEAMATCVPINALISVDLPTFGRPTTATNPDLYTVWSCGLLSCVVHWFTAPCSLLRPVRLACPVPHHRHARRSPAPPLSSRPSSDGPLNPRR